MRPVSLILLTLLGSACSTGPVHVIDRQSLPTARTLGGCSFAGPIASDAGKLTLEDAKTALTSSGEQCTTGIAKGVCLRDNDPHINWSMQGCPANYAAKCPLAEKKDWFLYAGPSSALVSGGLDAQKAAFVLSCKTEGKTPVFK